MVLRCSRPGAPASGCPGSERSTASDLQVAVSEPPLLHGAPFRCHQEYSGLAWYCSSLTFSIQSTVLPSRGSRIAMCVMAVVAVAPCQCFSPGGHQITSPGRIALIGPPQLCTRPQPAVTIRV